MYISKSKTNTDQCEEKTYTFSSKPKAVTNKYRDDKWACGDNRVVPIHFGLMAYDPRIVRGNTFARNLVPYDNPLPIDAIEVQRRRAVLKRTVETKRKALQTQMVFSPEPVDGRFHRRAQTELYLEELKDVVDTIDADCQTDLFIEKPPTPHYIPEKEGWDKDTQIYEGDLFDFDVEVGPILEVLVGKTTEQALMEVAEEEELAAIREQQRIFEELRNAEHEEEQRLEEQERRRNNEKIRRLKQELDRLRQEKLLQSKMAARGFARGFLSDLVFDVFARLVDQSYFYDTVEKDIEYHVLPWLMENVGVEMEQSETAFQLLDLIIRDVVDFRFQVKKVMNSSEISSIPAFLTSAHYQLEPQQQSQQYEGQQDDKSEANLTDLSKSESILGVKTEEEK